MISDPVARYRELWARYFEAVAQVRAEGAVRVRRGRLVAHPALLEQERCGRELIALFAQFGITEGREA